MSNKQTVQHPIFKGKRYCFCYHGSSTTSTCGDPYGYENHYDWKNALTVLWSEDELKTFRPNDTIHGFKMFLITELEAEIKILKKKLKGLSAKYIEVKQELNERIEFLKYHTVTFVEIDFVEKKEISGYY